MKDIDTNEFCPHCGAPGERHFVPARVMFSKTSVQHAEFNPGLGCVVKSAYERSEIAKRKGMTEVGNDYKSGEVMQKAYDSAREEKLKKRYEDI